MESELVQKILQVEPGFVKSDFVKPRFAGSYRTGGNPAGPWSLGIAAGIGAVTVLAVIRRSVRRMLAQSYS